LARLALRLDRIRLAVWIYALVGLFASTAYSLKSLYPSVLERVAFGATITSNPTLLALTGRLYDSTTIGGLTAWRFGALGGVVAAMMSVFTVVRHTRAEEESGRTELVGAGVVGRRAQLTSALVVVAGANAVIALLLAAVLVLLGVGGAGAWALGAGVGAAGLAFGAVAAVAAQLTDGARGANGIAMSVLGATFVLRAIGDSSGPHASFLTWLSPIGWVELIQAYAGERWWVFGLFVVLVAVLVSAAYALVGRRDVGAGLRPTTLGPARAVPSLRSAFALAWRLQRGSLIGWSIGLFLTGAAVGGVAKNIGSLIKTSSQIQSILQRLGGTSSFADVYLAATLGIYAMVAAAYGVQAMSRARSEETGLRAETVLATQASRAAFYASHLVIALAGSAVVLLACGLGAGLAYGAALGDVGGQVPRLLGAALAAWPAVAVIAGFAGALFGLWPRATTLAWAVLGGLVLLGQIGPVIRLPHQVMDISPFTHSPKLPGGVLYGTPLAILVAISAALAAAGLLGFRRRDIG
jgi:ABC-2 type transport system permease protein